MYQVLTLMWEIQTLQLQALGQYQIFASIQFTQIPLIHKGMPQISSNANPQSKFPCELLNPVWNPVASHDPFGQSKQTTRNIPSGSQAHVGNEKRVDGGRLKRPFQNVTWSGLSEGNPGLTLHQSNSF
ncbi:hypothetical protein O181_128032 [Austropuccinia psidii MF-1]|uniref:Uncharacterized protein n=1 Tax=Austropuccinia psidii MF-1 TaxID=1389203 RepID=A0A9Q3KZ22_9BASI|nr:hypothetical protein [Austropuccinia psidii MF-1]